MSFWSSIGNFFKHLFTTVRPGLEDFLKKHEEFALTEVDKLLTANDGKGLNDWKDEAFTLLKNEISKDEQDIKDNWISILLHFAYEEIKGRQAKK